MLCSTCIGVLLQERNLIEPDAPLRALPTSEDEDSYNNGQEQKSAEELSVTKETGLIASNTCADDLPKDHLAAANRPMSRGNAADVACWLKPRKPGKYGHHRSLADLQESISSGCQICIQSWNYLDEEQRLSLIDEEGLNTKMAASSGLAGYLTYAELRIFSGEGSKPHCSLKIDTKHSKGSQWISSFTLYPESDVLTNVTGKQIISDWTPSQDSLSTAKQWLDACIGSHITCSYDKVVPQWYPTRLLDLGDLDQEEFVVKLLHTRKYENLGPYMTLSHRWGKATFLQLNSRNLDSFSHEIPITELPPTFYDAVLVSRALQIRYLWIDSLCIKQDDKLDWQAEASQMHLVYSHSYCNISASHARDSSTSTGLFQQRKSRLLHDTRIDLCLDDRCSIGEEHRSFVVCDDWLFLKNVPQSTLSKRGWVFQERMLAPRVLHFCSSQLFWECHHRVACEQYPSGIPPVIYQNIPKGLAKDFRSNPLWYHPWNDIVTAYTRTSLTYPADKLVALSGVAKMIRSELKDTYVAGMWYKTLAKELLWFRDHNSETTRPPTYRAPSWSWASVEGPIFPHLTPPDEAGPDHMIAKVEEVCLEHTTDDDTGQIKDGWLDLTGTLKPVTLVWHGAWSVVPTWAECHSLGTSTGLLMDDTLDDKDIVAQRSASAQYFCMPFYESTGRWFSDFHKRRHLSLVLRLVDAEKALFERVGRGFGRDQRCLQWLHRELDESVKKSLPCLRYRNGKHTIRII